MWGQIIGIGLGMLDKMGDRNPRGPGLPYKDLADAEAERIRAIFTDPTGSDEFLAFKGGLGESLARYRSQLRGAAGRSGISQRSGTFARAQTQADSEVLSQATEKTSAFLAQLLRDNPGRLQQLLSIVGQFELGKFGTEVSGYQRGDSWLDVIGGGLDTGKDIQDWIDGMKEA